MDVGRSFTYMLQQPGGLGKILIGGLLMFVPIVGWALVAGYMIRTLRQVSAGVDTLPEWTDWGQLLVTGLMVWAGSFIYEIPGMIIGRFGVGGTLLSSLWSLVVFIVLPAALIRFAATDSFGSFFDFSEILAFIQSNSSNYILAVVLTLVAGFLSMFGLILLVVGVVFTIMWSALVMAHLYGSVWANQPRTVS
ncbi:MAG TPA: DUF4013 domain-containing protein [Thermoleophilia bacterium]|nr:DUF4013 domain-containing protein [Thermoleophilia bacterium]